MIRQSCFIYEWSSTVQDYFFVILQYLDSFAHFPHPEIQSFWNGTYVKKPNTKWHIGEVESGVQAVTGVGGAGMTLSFGLADLT